MRLNTLHSYYRQRSPGKTLLASPQGVVVKNKHHRKAGVVYSSTQLCRLDLDSDPAKISLVDYDEAGLRAAA
jgi:hypothetical protein